MPDQPGTFEAVALELSHALEPVAELLGGDGAMTLLAELGLRLPHDAMTPALESSLNTAVVAAEALPPAAQDLVTAIEGGDALKIIATGAVLVEKVVVLITSLKDVATQLGAIPPIPGLSAADLATFVADLPVRLTEKILVEYLDSYHRLPAAVLELLGLTVQTRQNVGSSDMFRPEFVEKRLRLDRLEKLLRSPGDLVQELYGWGQPGFDGALLLQRLAKLFQALRIPVTTLELAGPPARPAIEVCLLTIAPTAGLTPPGLEATVLLEVPEGVEIDLPFLEGWAAELRAHAQVGVSSTVRVQPPAAVSIVPPVGTVQGQLSTGVARVPVPPATNIVLLGVAGGSGLTANRIELGFVSGLQWDTATNRARGDFGFEAGIKGGRLHVDMSQGDGFLTTILSGFAVDANFEAGFGWTSGGGLYFTGSSGLQVQLPVHISLGPVDLTALTLTVGIEGGTFPVALTTNIRAALGPLTAVVEQIGAAAELSFPSDHSGNLGPLRLDFAFKPPSGVGLSIDAGVVTGGGYLYIDTDRGEYAGALQLMVADTLALSAIGLISTRMPDGSAGFSLLIIVTAEFGAGIQLGFGFTLDAVGGLLGLNRTLLFQPLMDGVRTGAVDSIMFPHDVIANAPRIISDLRAIFPPQQGIFLIGPMAKLGWGEPTLVSLSLGVIIEIPPGDVAILGVLKLALPAEDEAILLLQVNFAGALEFDKQRFYFFASLFDSRILFITIEGEMGVLFAYGHDANFVVSVGGFHPQFAPPPLPFPSPRRIQVDIINESFARIRCDGYFAVTTNTVQFGTHAEFFFGFDALNVQGHAGFDALFQFSPFHFTVSISASFSLQVFGIGLFGIDVDLTLEGTTPWRAHGTASISFFFFSIGIGIDVTWGDSRDTTLPPVAVMPILVAELVKQSNWRAVLPSGSNVLVSLRKLDPAEAQFVLHPVGTLQVSQRAVPLDLVLDKVGNTKPADANHFSLRVTSADLVKTRDLQESFPPSQFKNYADSAKLSQPAYAPLDSGIELSAAGDAYASGAAITRIVRYDLTVIDTKRHRLVTRFFTYAGALFAHFLHGASVTRSPLSAFVRQQTHPFEGAVTVTPETFAVARQSDNTVFHPEAASFTSRAAAGDYLARAVAADPTLAGTLHVLPQFEVAA